MNSKKEDSSEPKVKSGLFSSTLKIACVAHALWMTLQRARMGRAGSRAADEHGFASWLEGCGHACMLCMCLQRGLHRGGSPSQA